jgi:hypothetical protein
MRTILEIAYELSTNEEATKNEAKKGSYADYFIYKLLPNVLTTEENAYYDNSDKLEIYDTFVELLKG